jgi:hypothetical protein
MQGGFYRPASTIPIKALSPLLVFGSPTGPQNLWGGIRIALANRIRGIRG